MKREIIKGKIPTILCGHFHLEFVAGRKTASKAGE